MTCMPEEPKCVSTGEFLDELKTASSWNILQDLEGGHVRLVCHRETGDEVFQVCLSELPTPVVKTFVRDLSELIRSPEILASRKME